MGALLFPLFSFYRICFLGRGEEYWLENEFTGCGWWEWEKNLRQGFNGVGGGEGVENKINDQNAVWGCSGESGGIKFRP